MKVLVTGASSIVGESLAVAFSQGNHLVLMGRDLKRLQTVEERCRHSGAIQTTVRAVDIAGLSQADWREYTRGVALVVHCSFQLSQKRDDQINAEELEGLTAANLSAPLQLFAAAAHNADQGRVVSIILISSFLAKVRSPNRLIYSSFKILQEEFLASIQRKNQFVRVLVVHIGQVLRTDQPSQAAGLLADAVAKAYNSGKSRLGYGRLGTLLVLLFYGQPLIYFMVSAMQRSLRQWLASMGTSKLNPNH